jgi:hypothetical protein
MCIGNSLLSNSFLQALNVSDALLGAKVVKAMLLMETDHYDAVC